MIPALLLLPPISIDDGGLGELAGLVAQLGEGRTVLIGAQRTPADEVLDEFVVACGVRSFDAGPAIGVAARVGEGRAASIVAREATAAQLLGACDVLFLAGDASRCRDAAKVVGALFSGGTRTVVTATERIDGARNHPLPDAAGGLAVLWREGGDLYRLGPVGDAPSRCGSVFAAGPSALPTPEPGVLVVLEHPLGPPASLRASLAR